MDFGDILNKWESKQPRKNESGAMETWLKDNNVYDKDADERRTSGSQGHHPGENRRRLLNGKPDDILDIHGLTEEKAWLSLDNFFNSAKEQGFKKLRIIHGKGNHSQGEAVLGRTVLKFIEQCPYGGESGYEKAANGGSGATWVLLK